MRLFNEKQIKLVRTDYVINRMPKSLKADSTEYFAFIRGYLLSVADIYRVSYSFVHIGGNITFAARSKDKKIGMAVACKKYFDGKKKYREKMLEYRKKQLSLQNKDS